MAKARKSERAEVDLFAGFATERLRAADAEIFARIGGSGPPLLLLHGYPQTHVCWHEVAHRLAQHLTVIVCDLPGYGQSRRTSRDESEELGYSKRAMARTLVTAMRTLGFDRFRLAGHDRGARVAYRLALDHPEVVDRLCVLAILPTFAMWSQLQQNEYAMKAYRWFLLAQPAPLPEQLIVPNAAAYLRATLEEWTARKSLAIFAPAALRAYETAFTDPLTIAASCRDYRAGWTIDRHHDAADLESGRRIRCPTLVLWGRGEFQDQGEVLSSWARLCADLQGKAIDCGHFLPEEAAGEVSGMLAEFFLPS